MGEAGARWQGRGREGCDELKAVYQDPIRKEGRKCRKGGRRDEGGKVSVRKERLTRPLLRMSTYRAAGL